MKKEELTNMNFNDEVEKYKFEKLYVNNNEPIEIKKGDSVKIPLSICFNEKKYVKLTLLNTVNVKGKFYYIDDNNKEMIEEFYIESSKKTQEFQQFLDAFRSPSTTKKDGVVKSEHYDEFGQAKNATKLVAIEFNNVDETDGLLQLQAIDFSNRSINTNFLLIENEYYKVGISLKFGGALSYLEFLPNKNKKLQLVVDKDSNIPYIGINAEEKENCKLISSNINLVDTYDTGRLVQQSYYGISYADKGITYFGNKWSYNPVQGGDVSDNVAQVIDYHLLKDAIYVKTRAMDWALNGHTTPSYMETLIVLKGKLIEVKNSFVDWSGLNHNVVSDQEVPAFYTHYALTHFVTYRGDKPFINEPLYTKTNLGFWGENGQEDAYYDCTENWVAWTNEEYFGIGLFAPGVSHILNGSYHDKSYKENSDSTNYSAPIIRCGMVTYKRTGYTYYLTVGKIEEIRKEFNEECKKINVRKEN